MTMNILIDGLREVANRSEGIKREETVEWHFFVASYNELKRDQTDKNKHTFGVIPKFYHDVMDVDSLPSKLREEARSLCLRRKSLSLLDNNELRALWALLDEFRSPTDFQSEELITYSGLRNVLLRASPKGKTYFTAKLFAQLQQDDVHNRVSILSLFNYGMRKAWLGQTRIGLSLYDANGKGFLTESDLENYISDLIPTLPSLNCLQKSFHCFYVCTGVRKFFFFLDPMRTGKIRIQDVLACGFLDDLLELRDNDCPTVLGDVNWFSSTSALRVYGQYLNLDKDHNGMLSKSELAGFGTGTLTNVFLDRVFQECLTYESEMDYKTYLDFVLAVGNRQEPQSLHYFFKILDIKGQGFLDAFTLKYFFRAIQEEMTRNGQELVSFRDIKDELFDMIRPVDPLRITLQDILNCGQGGRVVSILIDINGFWEHENRETDTIENSSID